MHAIAQALPLATATDPAADHELVCLYLEGDQRALDLLFARYYRQLYRLAFRYARDTDEAEELVQRTFVATLPKLRRLRAPGAFKPYLFKAASNLCRNYLRDCARRLLGLPLEVATTNHEPLVMEEERRRLRDCLGRLSLRQRQVVSLRIDAELSFAELACALSITEINARVTFHQATARLRSLIRSEEES